MYNLFPKKRELQLKLKTSTERDMRKKSKNEEGSEKNSLTNDKREVLETRELTKHLLVKKKQSSPER